jgi:hypothetical protein
LHQAPRANLRRAALWLPILRLVKKKKDSSRKIDRTRAKADTPKIAGKKFAPHYCPPVARRAAK